MNNEKQTFTATCYQFPNGRYLSLDEVKNHTYKIIAYSIEEAWIQVEEKEMVDSKIPVSDRWTINS